MGRRKEHKIKCVKKYFNFYPDLLSTNSLLLILLTKKGKKGEVFVLAIMVFFSASKMLTMQSQLR